MAGDLLGTPLSEGLVNPGGTRPSYIGMKDSQLIDVARPCPLLFTVSRGISAEAQDVFYSSKLLRLTKISSSTWPSKVERAQRLKITREARKCIFEDHEGGETRLLDVFACLPALRVIIVEYNTTQIPLQQAVRIALTLEGVGGMNWHAVGNSRLSARQKSKESCSDAEISIAFYREFARG